MLCVNQPIQVFVQNADIQANEKESGEIVRASVSLFGDKLIRANKKMRKQNTKKIK